MKIKDTPSWVLPHNVLVKDCLLFFSPIAVWPVDGFFFLVAFQWDHWAIDVIPTFWTTISNTAWPTLLSISVFRSWSNLEASLMFDLSFCRDRIVCLTWHAWQRGNTIQYFCCCHMRSWCILFGEYCATTCIVFDVVSAKNHTALTVLRVSDDRKSISVAKSRLFCCWLFLRRWWRIQYVQLSTCFTLAVIELSPSPCPLQSLLSESVRLCW